MKQSEKVAFPDKPINQSQLSKEFKTVTELLGFHRFSDLLQHRTIQLQKLPGFDQHLIYEYVEFMETNQMGHLIDP